MEVRESAARGPFCIWPADYAAVHESVHVPISDMPITACGPPNPTQLRILDVALDEDFSLLSVRAHYMRGPGPKWLEKHARNSGFTS